MRQSQTVDRVALAVRHHTVVSIEIDTEMSSVDPAPRHIVESSQVVVADRCSYWFVERFALAVLDDPNKSRSHLVSMTTMR